MSRYWCGVVSREHIKRGEEGGFCQVCHGKRGPLERMAVGDGIVFYSPVDEFKGTQKCQRFTAIGRVRGAGTYAFQMAPGFVPFRRDVEYFGATEVPIQPLLPELEFTRGSSNWGYRFRFGHFELSEHDFLLIAQRMLPQAWQAHREAHAAAPAPSQPGQPELFAAADPPRPRRRRSPASAGAD